MTEPFATGPLTHGFLFADLRGYTAFAEAHGDIAAANLLDRYRALVRDVVVRTDGAEIKTEGDSFYVVFGSASRAVAAGLAIVAAATEASAADPAHPIRVGVGIHAGEAEERPDGYVGSAVNLAARVCSVAQPGEVLVTDMVRGLTRTSGRYRFTARGKPALKGIAEPVALFRVDAADGSPIAPRRTSRPRARTAAVAGLALVLALVLVGVTIEARGGSTASSPSGSAATSTVQAAASSSGPLAGASTALQLNGGPNAPGTHCSSTFTPMVCLTLPKGWAVITELPTEILLTDQPNVADSYQNGSGFRAYAELGAEWQSITISRPSVSVVPCTRFQPVGSGSQVEPQTATIGSSRQDFVDQLRKRPDLHVSEPVPSQLGSADVFVTDVTRARSCGIPIVYLDWWAFCNCPNGYADYRGFAAVPGATNRLFALDHGDQTIVIAVTAPTARFPAYVDEAKSLLSSLTFGP